MACILSPLHAVAQGPPKQREGRPKADQTKPPASSTLHRCHNKLQSCHNGNYDSLFQIQVLNLRVLVGSLSQNTSTGFARVFHWHRLYRSRGQEWWLSLSREKWAASTPRWCMPAFPTSLESTSSPGHSPVKPPRPPPVASSTRTTLTRSPKEPPNRHHHNIHLLSTASPTYVPAHPWVRPQRYGPHASTASYSHVR